ncbi:amino acid ABC transporter substrate-binding protein [Shewanella sp. Scap07]|uniref:substrate-binding periplasmic protein n=1 Tax=Shewanella sp. Scap07 TaxID=2589987 RepID=UPI0015BFD1E7|nr:transporter substrate-binding domain-containing protein [Shewanella sp. Scap07]QLE83986.1 amino acid ABC transporter substrate-binding protein [Shewanella sp. Scap07]
MDRLCKLIVLAILSLSLPNASAEQEFIKPNLTFCVEDTEFPPYNYFERVNGNKQATQGYDVDILAEVFAETGIEYKIVALPWRRCLKEVREGLIDAAMSASLNPQRQRDYVATQAYYALTPSYFYLQSDYPDSPDISHLDQLLTLGHICGIKGFNYRNFGLTQLQQIDEINDLAHLPDMLKRNRCEFFLARKETLLGTLAVNKLHEFDSLIQSQPVPNVRLEPFHMLISRKSAYSHIIEEQFNRIVSELQQSGETDKILQRHLNKLKKMNQ